MESPNSTLENPHLPPKASIKAEQLVPLISYCVAMELKKYNILHINEPHSSLQRDSPKSFSNTSYKDSPKNTGLEEKLSKIVEVQEKIQCDVSVQKSASVENLREIKSEVQEKFTQLNLKLQQVISDSLLEEKNKVLEKFSTFKTEMISVIEQTFDDQRKENCFTKSQVEEKVEQITQLQMQFVNSSEVSAHLVKEVGELKASQEKILRDVQTGHQKNPMEQHSQSQSASDMIDNYMKEDIRVLTSEVKRIQEVQENWKNEFTQMKETREKQINFQKEFSENVKKQLASEVQRQKFQATVSAEQLQMKQVQDKILHEQSQINKILEDISLSQTNLKETHAKIISSQKQMDLTQQQILQENSEMKDKVELILSTQSQTKDELFAHLRKNQDLISTERGLTRAALEQIKESHKKTSGKFNDDLSKIKEEHGVLEAQQRKQEKQANNIWKEQTKISKLWDKCYKEQQTLTEDNLKMNHETLKINAELENMKLAQDKMLSDQCELVESCDYSKQEIKKIWKQFEENGQINTSASSDDSNDKVAQRTVHYRDRDEGESSPKISRSKGAAGDDDDPRRAEETNSTPTILDSRNLTNSNSLRPKDDPEFYRAMKLYDVIDDDDYSGDDEGATIPKEEIKPSPDLCETKESMLDPGSNDVDEKTFSLDPEFYCMVVDQDGNDIDDDSVAIIGEVCPKNAPQSNLGSANAVNLPKDVKQAIPSSSVVTKSEITSSISQTQTQPAVSSGLKTRSRSASEYPDKRK